MMWCILICNILITMCFGTSQDWKVDLDHAETSPFYYYWDKCVGSGHAALMLRKDWRTYMKQGVDTIGFKYVRAHGILDDDVGAVNGINDYSFVNIDKIYSYLLSIKMKPYIEISWMPNLLSSSNATSIHYKCNLSPPKDYNVWHDFIKQWVQHLVDTFGVDEVSMWPFEVWNEPNNKHWKGSPKYETYFALYNATASAIKSVNHRLQVGGPTTSNPDWINRFLNDTLSMNIPVDFVAFHSYPSKQTPLSGYKQTIQNAIHLVEEYNHKYQVELTSMISEYASTCCQPFDGYDDNYASSFLIYAGMYLQSLFPKQEESTLKWMSYWVISDVFEEHGFGSDEFNGVYGMQTIRGIAKPAFRAMELLQTFGGNASYPTTLMTESEAQNNTVLVYTLRNNNAYNAQRFSIFISNFNSQALPIEAHHLHIYVNSNVKLNDIVMYRIDSDHTNPVQIWKDMSSPTYPTDAELQKINDTSRLIAIHN
eukprot:193908_1